MVPSLYDIALAFVLFLIVWFVWRGAALAIKKVKAACVELPGAKIIVFLF
jgi:hypothetical protein